MTKHICDCGQGYSDLAGLEACQCGNHGQPVVRVPPSAMLRERIQLVAAEWTLNGGGRDRLASQIEGIVDEAVREAILVTGKVFK